MSYLAFVEVPVKSLLAIVNPFEKPPWYCDPFTEADVEKAIEEERFQDEPKIFSALKYLI